MDTTPHQVEATDAQVATTNAVLDWVEGQCLHLAASVEGLGDQDLRSSRLPSGWTPLEMLAHVGESTCFWLENVVLGTPLDSFDEAADWPRAPEGEASQVIAKFTADCARAVAAARGVPADAAPGWWPDGAWGGYRQRTVLGVLLHLLSDNAAHTGQLDVARELADGGVWDFSINGVRVP